MTSPDPEFRERMWESKIPSYARTRNPYHSKFGPFREAIAGLDPSKPVWFRVDWDLPWPQKEPMYVLWGVAAKGSLMNGSHVIVHDASAIVSRAAQDWFSFLDDYEARMLFLYEFVEFSNEEYNTLAKVYLHWQENGWPVWCRSYQTPQEFVSAIPKGLTFRVDRFRSAFRHAQLIEASEYV